MITSTTDKVGPTLLTGLPQTIPVFAFQTATDLLVLDTGPTSAPYDPAVVLTLDSDYTVTGGGYNLANQMQTGSVTLNSGGTGGVAVNDNIVIMRNVPVNQPTSLIETGPLTIALVEQIADRLATISQEFQENISRCLQFENFEFLSGILKLAARKNMVLAFDANGLPTFIGQSSVAGDASGETVTATGSTTPRSLAKRFADTANALDFGADPTGTNDSTAAIQSAINYVISAGGGALYIPDGTYLINTGTNTGDGYTTALTVAYNSIWGYQGPKINIYGSGKSTILKTTAANMNVFRLAGSSIELSNMVIWNATQTGTAAIIIGPPNLSATTGTTFSTLDKISNIQFVGSLYAIISQAAPAGGGNFFNSVVDCDFENCLYGAYLKDYAGNSLLSGTTTHMSFERCHFWQNCNTGVWVEQATNTHIIDCTFDQITASGLQTNATAIYIAENPTTSNASRNPSATYYDNGGNEVIACTFEGNTVDMENHSNNTFVRGYLYMANVVQPTMGQSNFVPGVKYPYHLGDEGQGSNPSVTGNILPGFVYRGAGLASGIMADFPYGNSTTQPLTISDGLTLASVWTLTGQTKISDAGGAAFTPVAWGIPSLDLNGVSGTVFAFYYNGGNVGYLGSAATQLLLTARGSNTLGLKSAGGGMTVAASGVVTFDGDPIIPTATPASSSAAGAAGTITWDASYIYICTATNTWKRVAISTW